MFAYGVFKAIYSPFEAFKEIVENPKYIGPILIIILFVATYATSAYVAASKIHYEQILPTALEKDKWTENRTLWTSDTNITESADCISGICYGNKSMEFSGVNSTQIWMQLNNIGPISCSGIEGYKNISFRIKLICQNTTELNNASLSLYSSSTDYFYYNLTKHFTPLNATVWNNLTIPIGPESGSWLNGTHEANWDNITGLRLEFAWLENVNVTLRLDGLFFRGVFKSELENAASHMLNYSLFAFMKFTIEWVILSGVLYIVSKALGGKTVWRPLLILVGFALITLFIQAVINTATYATLPALYHPLEYLGGVEGEFEIAYSKILEQTSLVSTIGNYVQMAIYIWTIALCAIALRLLTEFFWIKSILVATAAYLASIVIESFILL